MIDRSGLTLTLWHAWQGVERVVLGHWVEAYTARHNDVRIETTFYPLNELGARFADATAAGLGPDCVVGPPEWLARWVLEGLARPLDDVLDTTTRGRVCQVTWDAVAWEGSVYAVPVLCTTLALYYDKGRLIEPPATFEAMLGAAAQSGLIFNTSVPWAVPYLHALGGSLMDESGDPALQGAVGECWLSGLVQAYHAEGVVLGHTGDAFMRSEAAMVVDGPWKLAPYRAALGDRLGVAVLPMFEGESAAPWVRTENVYISRAAGGETPAAVMHFLASVLSEPVQTEEALSVNLDAALGDNPLLAGFAAQVAQGVAFPNRPELEAYWVPVQRAIDAVTVRDADPTVELNAAARAIETRIAEIRANLPDSVYPTFAAATVRRSVMAEEPIFPFVLQGDVVFSAQDVHPEFGCSWQGIAGGMRSMDGEPLTRVVMVHVRGSGLNVFVVAGTAVDHGPGGWEVTVGEAAVSDTYHVTLMHTNGELLSETFRVRFPGDCASNLAKLDFVQVKPL